MSTAVERLGALVAAAAPIDGVSILAPERAADAGWHVVTRGDGVRVRVDYQPSATQQQITSGDAVVMSATLGGDRKPRSLWAIYSDLNALSATVQANIWTAFTAGSPPLWTGDAGNNSAAIMALHWSAVNSGATAANLNDARRRAVAAYVQDNPLWLVNQGINVPGDEPV